MLMLELAAASSPVGLRLAMLPEPIVAAAKQASPSLFWPLLLY